MDRELVLATLALPLCGAALLAGSLLRLRLRAPTSSRSARALERHTWARIWLPLLPAALVLAFLTGWALQEPEDAEVAQPLLVIAAIGCAVIWLRAGTRAIRALRPASGLAMTSGLLRPRVTIAPSLAAHLDPRALAAVHAHEAAHARHRDPLRLWLAQLATDLQWPSQTARQRFADWRSALELARDAEACESVDGSDLAAALIGAAQLGAGSSATVGLLGDSDRAFADRIHRLLEPSPIDRAPASRRWIGVLVMLSLAAAIGAAYGEAIVGWFPGLG